jgi:DNA polymerase III subunit beta
LSKVDRTIAGPVLSAGIIVPKKGLAEIKKLLESSTSCKLAVKTPYIYVVSDDIALAVKLIDAQFPPYDAVIPKDHKKVCIVDRSRLIDALKRAQLAVGFNPKYVMELLGQISAEQVSINLGGELDPGLIKPVGGDEYLGVVMPMRI